MKNINGIKIISSISFINNATDSKTFIIDSIFDKFFHSKTSEMINRMIIKIAKKKAEKFSFKTSGIDSSTGSPKNLERIILLV